MNLIPKPNQITITEGTYLLPAVISLSAQFADANEVFLERLAQISPYRSLAQGDPLNFSNPRLYLPQSPVKIRVRRPHGQRQLSFPAAVRSGHVSFHPSDQTVFLLRHRVRQHFCPVVRSDRKPIRSHSLKKGFRYEKFQSGQNPYHYHTGRGSR